MKLLNCVGFYMRRKSRNECFVSNICKHSCNSVISFLTFRALVVWQDTSLESFKENFERQKKNTFRNKIIATSWPELFYVDWFCLHAFQTASYFLKRSGKLNSFPSWKLVTVLSHKQCHQYGATGAFNIRIQTTKLITFIQ